MREKPEPLSQSGEAGKGKVTAREDPLPSAGGFIMAEKLIMTEVEIQRALRRVAHEVLERNWGGHDLVLVGLHTRGVPLAQRLADLIAEISLVQVPVGALDITPHRDDRPFSVREARLPSGKIPVSIQGAAVVLVDDVLFTGRSVRAAMEALLGFGRPQRIQVAVLVDRGHRELPIRADYVGKNVPTSRLERVQVRLGEIDGRDEVVIQRQTQEAALEPSFLERGRR